MKITNTKNKATEYVKKAPLTEKKRNPMIAVKLTDEEAEILDNYIDSLQTVGIRRTRSSFIRQAIFEYIENHSNVPDEEKPDVWKDEPLTTAEASKLYGVPTPTIRSALIKHRFGPREYKKLDNGEWVVTRSGMDRLYKEKRPFEEE